MAVVYSTALKNTRLDAVTTAVDAGAGAGVLELGTAGMAAVLVTITLDDPSAPSAAGGVLTFTNVPALENTASGTGIAVEARIRDSDSNDVVTGLSVGTSGTDVVLNSNSLVTGQTVTIQTASITHG